MKPLWSWPIVRRMMIAIALVSLVAVGAMPAAEGKPDYKSCVSDCEAKVPRVEETEKNCEATIQHVAHDVLIMKSYLETTKLCRGPLLEACKEWQAATVDALTRVADAIGVTPGCGTVKIEGLLENLWPFSTAKACVGDGIFTDFHDYLGGKQKVVDDLAARNLHYALVQQPIDGILGDAQSAPVCMDGMRPIRLYFPSLLRMHDTLKAIPDYQACMSQCRKPTRFEERLGLLPERLDAAALRLEEVLGAFQAAQAQRDAQMRDLGQVPVGCVAFQRALDFLAGADSEVGDLRKGISAAEELGAGLDEPTVAVLEARLQKLEESVAGYDLAAASKDCDAETRTAIELVGRKQKIMDDLTGSREVALEASIRFGVAEEVPSSCESTADCPIPYRCQSAKCKTSVDVDRAHEALLDAGKLLKQARSAELMGKNGMVERANERLDALEVRFREIRKELADTGWTHEVEPWAEEFKKEQLARLGQFQSELEALMVGMDQEEGSSKEQRECRRGKRGLETCLVDLAQSREALSKSDPLGNAKWFNLKVLDAVRAVGECKAEATLRASACTPGEEKEGAGLHWGWITGAVVLAGLAGAGVIVWSLRRQRLPNN